MPTVTIAGSSYEVLGLSEEDQASYRAYCVLLARRADNPLERFFARNSNLTPQQQEIALRVERGLSDWNDPPEEAVLEWARHPKAVAALARRVLRPEKTGPEWEALIGTDAEAVYNAMASALRAIVAPSDDQIRQTNQAIRERLGHPGANAGGWPGQDQRHDQPQPPQGAEQCPDAAAAAHQE